MKVIRFYLVAFVAVCATFVAKGEFTADFSHGEVTIRYAATPDRIDPSVDTMLTITVESPADLVVRLPDLRDRFGGFSTAEDFARDPITANGRTRQVFRWRLVPKPAEDRYRLAPFAVQLEDKRSNPPTHSSFATAPVVFPKEGERPAVTGEAEVEIKPVHIRPTLQTVTLWGLAVVAGIALLALALWGLTRISRKVREHFQSPIERARERLQRLLDRDLPKRGMFKEFYVELTMVVRRYIEDAHAIRAPRQTTEEFLRAAAASPSFSAEVLSQLRTFLESADLVKFAGQEANSEMTDTATSHARDYLESDAQIVAAEQARQRKGGTR